MKKMNLLVITLLIGIAIILSACTTTLIQTKTAPVMMDEKNTSGVIMVRTVASMMKSNVSSNMSNNTMSENKILAVMVK